MAGPSKDDKDENNNEGSTSDSFSHDSTGGRDVDDSGSEEVRLHKTCRKFSISKRKINLLQEQDPPTPAAPAQPPSTMQTVEQLQEAAAQAQSVADMISKERKAVEARQLAEKRALEEQKKLAAAETELIRLQLELAGTLPPQEAMGFDYAAGADGDKDSSSGTSSDDDEPVLPRGDAKKVNWYLFAASLSQVENI